jgi:hypothetical protein
VLRRSEIVAIETLDISPIENALNEIEQKTKELLALELKYSALAKTTQPVSTNALAMCLNSAVDSPVDAGMASYRQTFFAPEYIVRHPDRAGQVEKLKKAVEDQVRLLKCAATSPDLASIGSGHRQLSATSCQTLPSGVYTVPRDPGRFLQEKFPRGDPKDTRRWTSLISITEKRGLPASKS